MLKCWKSPAVKSGATRKVLEDKNLLENSLENAAINIPRTNFPTNHNFFFFKLLTSRQIHSFRDLLSVLMFNYNRNNMNIMIVSSFLTLSLAILLWHDKVLWIYITKGSTYEWKVLKLKSLHVMSVKDDEGGRWWSFCIWQHSQSSSEWIK